MIDNRPIPPSFLDRPCSRCGQFEGRYDERGVCLCYWTQPKIEPQCATKEIERPTMEELRKRVR